MEKEDNEKLVPEVFRDALCKRVEELLGEDYETEVSRVRKNNGVMKEVIYVKKKEFQKALALTGLSE
jgi:hypothetical protein